MKTLVRAILILALLATSFPVYASTLNYEEIAFQQTFVDPFLASMSKEDINTDGLPDLIVVYQSNSNDAGAFIFFGDKHNKLSQPDIIIPGDIGKVVIYNGGLVVSYPSDGYLIRFEGPFTDISSTTILEQCEGLIIPDSRGLKSVGKAMVAVGDKLLFNYHDDGRGYVRIISSNQYEDLMPPTRSNDWDGFGDAIAADNGKIVVGDPENRKMYSYPDGQSFEGAINFGNPILVVEGNILTNSIAPLFQDKESLVYIYRDGYYDNQYVLHFQGSAVLNQTYQGAVVVCSPGSDTIGLEYENNWINIKGAMFCVIGDFNGDGEVDLIFSQLHSSKLNVVYSFQGNYLSTDVNNTLLESPRSFILDQNFPNPFNGSTVVNLRLPVSSQVKLDIYNAAGQLVATAINQYLTAGEYNIQIDMGQCKSGIYHYRLTTNSHTSVRKMIMVK